MSDPTMAAADSAVRRSMVVVGLDGSGGGRRALRFALAEGMIRSCPVLAVRVIPPGADQDAAEAGLQAEVEVIGNEIPTAAQALTVVRRGDPAEVLIDLSATVTLLVVGSHGTSSLIHSALGSVSTACSQLAQCPVVVLPLAAPAVMPPVSAPGDSSRAG
jgi:nucleotide-binding universal stress UspA family protein